MNFIWIIRPVICFKAKNIFPVPRTHFFLTIFGPVLEEGAIAIPIPCASPGSDGFEPIVNDVLYTLCYTLCSRVATTRKDITL